jgi:hypothetical protein
MFARKGLFSSIGRAGAMATVVAVALTAVQPSMAFAGSATSSKGVTASTGTSDATDISARRRYYRGGGGAAAAAAFAGIVGTGIAIAATQNRRHYYDDGYYGGQAYYGDPAPYYGPRGYYGGGPYYRSWQTRSLKSKPLKMNPPAVRPVDFFMVAGSAVNTPATALD